jgi:hypothetical protein
MEHADKAAGASPAKRCVARALPHAPRARRRTDACVGARPCRSVVWNEANLTQCEAQKDAKMKIDEPETPWASPPKELFADEGAARHAAGATAHADSWAQRTQRRGAARAHVLD